jgi:diketogulonate reductase-like aldo/keto reductase
MVPAVEVGGVQSGGGSSEAHDMSLAALKLGHRHINGTNAYRNGRETGAASRQSCIPKEEIFVTSKL